MAHNRNQVYHNITEKVNGDESLNLINDTQVTVMEGRK